MFFIVLYFIMENLFIIIQSRKDSLMKAEVFFSRILFPTMNALFRSLYIFSFHANLFFSSQLIDKLSTDTEVDVILADYNTVSIYVHDYMYIL